MFFFFFFTDTPTTEIYTLSLHDALPIWYACCSDTPRGCVSCRTRPGSRRTRSCCESTRTPGSDRKSTRLNSSHVEISYAVFCLKKKKKTHYSYSSHRIVEP